MQFLGLRVLHEWPMISDALRRSWISDGVRRRRAARIVAFQQDLARLSRQLRATSGQLDEIQGVMPALQTSFGCDRITLYQVSTDRTGNILAQAGRSPDLAIVFTHPRFPAVWQQWQMSHAEAVTLSIWPASKRPNRLVLVPIFVDQTLWGVLEIIHQSTSPLLTDIPYLETLGEVFSSVISQSQLRHQLQSVQRDHAQKHQAQSQFLAHISHELRTPLNVILLAAQRLPIQSADNRNVKHIQASAQYLRQLVSEVLTTAQLDAQGRVFRPQVCSVHALCTRLVAEHQPPEHLIQLRYRGGTGDVLADAQLLYSVLSNLLTNALKYSPNSQPIYFEVNQQSTSLTFIVRDQGMGIPEAEQEHLFDSFYRGTNVGTISGSGLGLAIVKQCVELQHGHITLTSSEKVGTTVRVEIPIPDAQQTNLRTAITYENFVC